MYQSTYETCMFPDRFACASLTHRKVALDSSMHIVEEKLSKEMRQAIRMRLSATPPRESTPETTIHEHIYLTSNPFDYSQFWLLEREPPTIGGEIAFDQPFHIKNIKSGLYLAKHGLMEHSPSAKFYIPKPENLPENSAVPFGFEVVIACWEESRGPEDRRTVLAPEEKTGEEVCMPMIIPNMYQSTSDENRYTDIPAFLSPISIDNQTQIFQISPLTIEIPFMQKLAHILPKCKQIRQILSNWLHSVVSVDETTFEAYCDQLTSDMENLVRMLGVIGDTIRVAKTAEEFERRQNAVVGVELHIELLEIAEVIHQQTVKSSPHSSYYVTATHTAFTDIWETLIQVASENFFTCSSLETQKSRIVAIVSREKTLIGKLLTEIYRMVDPDMPNYSEDFGGWCQRLETLSAENIVEQTVFLNLIHCLCEVGDSVKVEYQQEVVRRIFDENCGFPVLRLIKKDGQYGVELFPRRGETVEKLVRGNPDLSPEAEMIARGQFFVTFESLKLKSAYIEYVYTALIFMNTLSKGEWREGRNRVRAVTNITPELALTMVKSESLHLKIRQACLSLCDTLITVEESPAYPPLKDPEDTCFLYSELEIDENDEFLDRQMTLQSPAITDCIRFTINLLLKNDLPAHIESYSFRQKLEYLHSTLSLTSSMLERGHYSLKDVKRLSYVIGYILAGLGGNSTEGSKERHWAMQLFAGKRRISDVHKSVDLELKLELNELFQVLMTLLYKIRGLFSREKVKKLLSYCTESIPSASDISQLLLEVERSMMISSLKVSSVRRESILRDRLLTTDQPNRQATSKQSEINEHMFRLVLGWGNIPNSLKDTVISLLSVLYDEKTYIYNVMKQAEVLYDSEVIDKYHSFRAKVESVNLSALLAEAKREVLEKGEGDCQAIDQLYEWVAETTDAICLRRGSASIRTLQNIIRCVNVHKCFLSLLHFSTHFPTLLSQLHLPLLRLQIALSSFFFYFVKTNPTNVSAVLPLLQKHHYFLLIPRYFDFISEIGQFEHMSKVEISRCVEFILRNLDEPRINSLHLLRVMMFDRNCRPIAGRQNTIARFVIEITAHDHILSVKSVRISARLIELLAFAAIDNEVIAVLCRRLLPLSSVYQLSDRGEAELHHALLLFVHYAYIRTNRSSQTIEKMYDDFVRLIEKSVELLSTLFEGNEDLVAVGRTGTYEHIFPKGRPTLVEEAETMGKSNETAALLRLLSSGNSWEIHGGLLHLLPSFFRHTPITSKSKPLSRHFSAKILRFQMTLRNLQTNYPDVDFSILISNIQECLVTLNEYFSDDTSGLLTIANLLQKTEPASIDTIDIEDTNEGRFHVKMTNFLKVYREAVNPHDDKPHLKEMVKIFLMMSLGSPEIGKKLSKDKLDAMTKVLLRLKKLFEGTRHRTLYFDFLRELIPAGHSHSDLMQKYSLNEVFLESDILLEVINALIASKSAPEVDSMCGFLNRLISMQQKDFMSEFLELLDSSDKSYYLFLQIKSELHSLKNILIARLNFKDTLSLSEDEILLLDKRTEVLSNALTFLQLCCDNCNIDFQNYMRKQRKREGQADVDMLSEVAQFVIDIRSLGKELLSNRKYGELVVTALAALTDFVSGPCKRNQQTLGENVQFFMAVDDLLRLTQLEVTNAVGNAIHENAILVLHALLEGAPEEYIYHNMGNYLKVRELRDGLERFHLEYVRHNEQKFMLEVMEIGDTFEVMVKKKLEIFLLQAILLIKLKANAEGSEDLKAFCYSEQDPDSAYNFFTAYIGYVEIARDDGDIQPYYFPIPFECKYLTPASRRSVIFEIDRSSHQKKIEEFIAWVPFAHREMEHQQLLSASKLLKFISCRWKFYAQLSFIVVLLINLILLFSLENSLEFTERHNSQAMVGIKVCGVIQILLYIACVVFLILEYFPAYFQVGDSQSSLEFSHYSFIPRNESQFTRVLFSRIREGKIKPSAIQLSFREVGNSLGLYYHYAYFLVSIMAIHDPMLYPILLLDLIKQNEELVNVLKSITLNFRQLVLTLVLGMIVIFLFSAYAFNFLQSDFDSDDALYCGTLWLCFSTTLYYGTRSGGGIGDVLSTPAADHSFERMVFDMLFFLVIIILFLNIIFGIIIDTFADLRDSRSEVLDDIHNVCFVCGAHRDEIDLHGSGWSSHFMCEHIPLSYLAFIIYVREKSLSDCSGIEKSVLERLSENDTSFLPTTFTLHSRKSKLPS